MISLYDFKYIKYVKKNYIICSNSPSLIPREFRFCGLFPLNRPARMTRLPEKIDIKNKVK